MTKTLFLLRHADASEKTPGGTDKQRALSEKGILETSQIAEFLAKNNFTADAVLCSAAVRTRQTLMLITEQLQNNQLKIFYSDDLYESGHNDLLSAICEIDDQCSTAMIVGHNPAISSVAAQLINRSISMHTCGLAKIDLEISSWRETKNRTGSLVEYIDPSMPNHNKTHA